MYAGSNNATLHKMLPHQRRTLENMPVRISTPFSKISSLANDVSAKRKPVSVSLIEILTHALRYQLRIQSLLVVCTLAVI